MTLFGDHSETAKLISNGNHHFIRLIRSLQRREERERTRLYYIEGVRFIAQATTYNAEIEALVVCPSLLASPLGQKLLHHHRQKGTVILEVTAEVLHSLAYVDDPQGIGAVVRQKWLPLERAKLGGKLCWIAIEEVQSPGNLGTILRTSDVVGGAGLILLGKSVDPYDPATVRATMGALFSQRFVRTTAAELIRWKTERQWLLVGTSPSAETDYQEVSYDLPTILLIGGERKGLSLELQAMCDLMVKIPMVGHSDSLNMAVATGVMLYELFNQRRRRSSRELR